MSIYRKALSEGNQKMPRCNLLVLGEERVGKTSLIRQLIGKSFIPDLKPTCGIENTCVKTVDVATIATNNENDWTTISQVDQAKQHSELIFNAVAERIEKDKPDFFNRGGVHQKIEQFYISEEELLKRIQHIRMKYSPVSQPLRAKRHNTHVSNKVKSPPTYQLPQETTSSVAKEVNRSKHAPRPHHDVKSAPQPSAEKIPFPVPDSSNKDQIQLVSKQNSDSKIMLTRRESKDFSKHLKSSKKVKPALIFNTLDFAGQKGYRPMHHCFISSQAIFIVVCNLNNLVQGNCNGKDTQNNAIQELNYWLNSIHGHCKMHSSRGASQHKYVFIVGTHKADVEAAQMAEIHLKLKEQFSNKRFFDDIHLFEQGENDSIFAAIENSFDKLNQRQESGIEDLKKELLKASESLPFLKEVRPISWLRLEDALHQKKKETSSPIMKWQDVAEIAKQCGVNAVNEIHIALQFFHDTGTIIYPGECVCMNIYIFFLSLTLLRIITGALSSLFLNDEDKKQLGNVILINPQWLIDLMKDLMEVKLSRTTCSNKEIHQLQTSGKTTASCLKSCWQKQFDEHVYKFMQAYGLICPINAPSTHYDTSSVNESYLVPCMLPDEIIRPDGTPRPTLDGSYFVFDFKSFLPEEVFFRFICLALKKTQEAGIPNPLYSRKRCVIFKMNNCHWDITFNREKHIFQVTVR